LKNVLFKRNRGGYGLSPARTSSRCIVVMDNERTQFSQRYRWYSSRNSIGLWWHNQKRYRISACNAFHGLPWPMAWILATDPVHLNCFWARKKVLWEIWTTSSISVSVSRPRTLSRRATILISSLIQRLTMMAGTSRHDIAWWPHFQILFLRSVIIF